MWKCSQNQHPNGTILPCSTLAAVDGDHSKSVQKGQECLLFKVTANISF